MNNGQPLTDDERDQTRLAMAHYTGRELASIVSSIIALAALWDKETVKTALRSVFDLEAVEETTRRMMHVVNETQKAVNDVRDKERAEAREFYAVIHKDLDVIERRMQSITQQVKNVEHRINRAAQLTAELMKALKGA